MAIQKILVTGHKEFIYRYYSLFDAISRYVEKIDRLSVEDIEGSRLETVLQQLEGIAHRLIYKFSVSLADQLFVKNARTFVKKSIKVERVIEKLSSKPDLILHIFGLCCPVWHSSIPYAMYIDYTMALAIKNWTPWAPFLNEKQRQSWLKCEQKAYQDALCIFTMNKVSKESLVSDYGIPPEKIFVVGSAGNFSHPYEGEKQFGTQQILFNGSDFERKGGYLALEAFRKVRSVLPESKLVIIGSKINIHEPGVTVLGKIRSRTKMQELFLSSDIVVAPSYCEPFQAFLLEALNYGVPCIVSNRDGMPEIIENEVDGYIVHQMSPDAFSTCMVKLLTDLPRLSSMSKKAQEKIKHKFNWDKIATQMLNALENQPEFRQ